MATFLITYHGDGGPPSSPEAGQQMLAAFRAWAESVGDHMIDPGAPLGAAQAVSPDGVGDADGRGPAGYTLITADDMNAAITMVSTHPFVGRGGTLIVSQAVAP